jgi:predicted dehydrogenase
MARTRVGIIGAGWAGQLHGRILAGFGDVEVVGISSGTLESAGRLAASLGARVFPDHRSMLDDAALDAVFVCVPPYAHGRPELDVVERGLAVLVEKPLGVDADGPEKVAKRIREAGVVSSVGYQWRYLEVVDRAREFLAASPPQLILGSWHGETPGAKWWIRNAQSGGQIVEQATHVYDLARFLAGEMEPVAAEGRRIPRPAYPDSDILDVTQTSVRFASGAIGSMTTTSLLGAANKVEIETVSEGMALTLEILTARLVVQRGVDTTVIRPPSVFETPYELQNRAFIDAVQGKPNRIRSTYEDSLLTHRLTIAATRLAAGRSPS